MKRALALTALLAVSVVVYLQRSSSEPAGAPDPGPRSGAASGTVQHSAEEAPERVELRGAGSGVAPVRRSSSELDAARSETVTISLSLQQWPEGFFRGGDGLADLRFADGTNAQAPIEGGQLEFQFASQPVGPVAICRIQCGGEDFVYPPYILCEVTPVGFSGGASGAGKIPVWAGRALPLAVVGADPGLTYELSAPGTRALALAKKFKKLEPLTSPLAIPVDPANPLDFVLKCSEGSAKVAAKQAGRDPCAPPLGVFLSRSGSVTLNLTKEASVPEDRELKLWRAEPAGSKLQSSTSLWDLEWAELPSGLESSAVIELSLQPGLHSLWLEGHEQPLDAFEVEAGSVIARDVHIERLDLREGELEVVLQFQEDYKNLVVALDGALAVSIERRDAPTKESEFRSRGWADWPPKPNAQDVARIISGEAGWGISDWPPDTNAPGTARIPFGEIPFGKYVVSIPGTGFAAELEHSAGGSTVHIRVPPITRLQLRSHSEDDLSVDLSSIHLVRLNRPLRDVQLRKTSSSDADVHRYLVCEGTVALHSTGGVGPPIPGTVEVAGSSQEVLLRSAGLGTLSVKAAEGGEYARMTWNRIVESVLLDPVGQEVAHDRRAMVSVRMTDDTFEKLRYGPLEPGPHELRLTYLSIDGQPITMTANVDVPAGDTQLSMDLDRGELILEE